MLTRRVKAKSARHAVVVRFSKSRRRYERQGLLVEPRALRDAQREVAPADALGPNQGAVTASRTLIISDRRIA